MAVNNQKLPLYLTQIITPRQKWKINYKGIRGLHRPWVNKKNPSENQSASHCVQNISSELCSEVGKCIY